MPAVPPTSPNLGLPRFAADSNPPAPTLTSVLDYHAEGDKSPPAWCEHRGVYSVPVAEEWQAWHASAEGGLMSLSAFAEFLRLEQQYWIQVTRDTGVRLTQ